MNYFSFFMLLALFAACKSSTSFPANREWTLTELKFKPVPANVTATIKFDSGQKRYAGKNACNAYSGTYELNGSTLKLGPAMATKMFCADVADWETAFMDMLPTVDNYTHQNGQLRLFSGTKVVAVFK